METVAEPEYAHADDSSISGLSDDALSYFSSTKSSWIAQPAGNASESDSDDEEPPHMVTYRALKSHNDAMDVPSVSTEFSTQEISTISSGALSFKLIQTLEEADESLYFPAPDSASISSCQVGTVLQSVNDIVTVIGDGAETIVDIGTFIATSSEVIGPVITLFGPIKRFYYAIRVEEQCDSDKISPGDPVFVVEGTLKPIQEDLQLASMKSATDASYVNDKELPLGVMPDFSDDEAERHWKHRKSSK